MRSALIFVIGLLLSTVAHALSAEELVSKCRPYANAKVDGEKITIPGTIDTNFCWGVFTATFNLTYLVDADTKRRFLPVCAPTGIRQTQYIKVFLKYADDHPERLNEEYFVVLLDSLRSVWPCH